MPGVVKVKSISVVLEEEGGDPQHTEIQCTQGEDFRWTIPGPLFPRHLSMLRDISSLRREADGSGRSPAEPL